jgi:hypothetical protein
MSSEFIEIIFTKIFIVFVEVAVFSHFDKTLFFDKTPPENSHDERGLTDWCLVFLQHAESFLG